MFSARPLSASHAQMQVLASIADYRRTKNPLFLWNAYAVARTNNLELPEAALQYFDRCAEQLLAGERPAAALQFPKGAHVHASALNEAGASLIHALVSKEVSRRTGRDRVKHSIDAVAKMLGMNDANGRGVEKVTRIYYRVKPRRRRNIPSKS